MTKEELINLKKSLAVEIRKGTYYQAKIDLGQFVGVEKTGYLLATDIKQKSDTPGAINEIDEILTKIILKAPKLGIDLANLKVLINYGFFINTSYLNLKEHFGEGGPIHPLSLGDIMPNYLAIMSSYLIDVYSTHYSDIDLLKRTGNLFIVNYDEFINELIKHGYLKEKMNFEDFFASKKELSFQIDFEPSLKRIRKD